MLLFVCVLGTINGEVNGCVKSIVGIEKNENVVENTKVFDGKIELTSEATDTNIISLTENIQKCNIINNTNCNKLSASDKQEGSNYYCKSSQIKETDNYQNNNTSTNCDIVCINGSFKKITHNKVNTLDFSNSGNSVDIDGEKCKAEVYQFYQNLKLQLSKFNYFLNEPTTIKHVAHLEIEASKKKELENIVTEFENKRINSPNPFSFVAELKIFIHNYDQQ